MNKELTEQWKNGELKIRFYYVKLKDGSISTDFYAPMMFNNEFCRGFFKFEGEVKEVLAQVPTYEEYLESESHCAVYSDINNWNKEKIKQLESKLFACSELLKKCKEYIQNVETADTGLYLNREAVTLILKIDEVLND